jgi:hypothetical protein
MWKFLPQCFTQTMGFNSQTVALLKNKVFNSIQDISLDDLHVDENTNKDILGVNFIILEVTSVHTPSLYSSKITKNYTLRRESPGTSCLLPGAISREFSESRYRKSSRCLYPIVINGLDREHFIYSGALFRKILG